MIQVRNVLPPEVRTHYFTRNHTHGYDFPPFPTLSEKAPNIVPHCFRMRFWQRGRCSSFWLAGYDFS